MADPLTFERHLALDAIRYALLCAPGRGKDARKGMDGGHRTYREWYVARGIEPEEDREARILASWRAGLLTVNQARALGGLPPRPDAA